MPSKPPTIKEIARLLKLSISTVSRALHDHISIGIDTRQKVKNLALELNYEPNQTAIFLQQGKTKTIGVILPELSEDFFSTAVNAIEDIAYEQNYTVLLAQSHDDEEREKQLVEKMKNHRVDGLLISVAKNTNSYEHFDLLKRYNIPVVFFDRIPPLKNIHYVACNIETGTIQALNYLIKKGHRAIGLINGPLNMYVSKERRDGYLNALLKNRLKFDPSLVINCDLTKKEVELAIDKILKNKRKVTAIVTFNDYVALYAINYLRHNNLKSLDNIVFVSYSNLPLIQHMNHIPVASIEQYPYKQGQKATEILLDILKQKVDENPENEAFYKVIIESKLIENLKQVQ
jgi:LacI family transcriptional regulator